MGWFTKKLQNSRVVMTVKEVKWDLESGGERRQAKILALASVLGKEFFEGCGIPDDVANRPLDYSRADLMRFYEDLEDIKISMTQQIDGLKKMSSRMGMQFPKFAQDHAEDTRRALEIWMVTVGAGIVIDRRDDVRDIWGMLTNSKASLDVVMDEILALEAKTAEMTGEQSMIFSLISREDWKAYCDFVPTQFSKELHI
tara:strand:- start:1182 stop:1778 length:597 start_codon:yes stop_codon:yes gene_type:complete